MEKEFIIRRTNVAKKIINGITVIFILCLFLYSTVCTRKLNEARGLYNQYQQRCIEAERICDELNDRLGRIQEVVGKISEGTKRTVKNARDAAETVENLRVQIQELEDCIYGSGASDSYYDWLDSELGLQ